ncbi:MAG: hypothetical protein ACLQMF_06330 [Rectinemataceae bacterium]
MSTLKTVSVGSLDLDLDNYRTVHQVSENSAIETMIAISPDSFWSLLDSLIEDGFHPTENIIVQQVVERMVVKEGNRRVAALKIVLGQITGIDLPENLRVKIDALDSAWSGDNSSVPCSVYSEAEVQTVKKIVALIHAKGEKAGRDQWTSVARARFNRDEKNVKEPGLDLLEKYLKNGKNVSSVQIERWSGDYPLSVLDELLPKVYPSVSLKSVEEMVALYPKLNKATIDKILYDIGIQNLGFKEVRNKTIPVISLYGLAVPAPISTGSTPLTQSNGGGTFSFPPSGNTASEAVSPQSAPAIPHVAQQNPVATSLNDAKSVYKTLRTFKPRGAGREKVVLLLEELRTLKIETQPHSFCFLLRSLFEISAKAYCDDKKAANGPSATKSDGSERKLAEILKDIVGFATTNSTDKAKLKILHGALTEITKSEGILSVTSMNQLVHNPRFSIQPGDICILFSSVFPLLEEMNT